MNYREAYNLPPAHQNAQDGHTAEFGALASYLAARGLQRGEDEAAGRLMEVLGLTSESERIRLAFSERLARQREAGDVRGARATQVALRTVRDVTRRG